MTADHLRLTAIVPVHNGGSDFRRCLSQLIAALPPPDEIVVVGDGDTDGSVAFARARGVAVLAHLPPARGPAHARNQGAARASGDILFFVDADVLIAPDTIARVRDVFQHEPDLTAMIGSYDDQPGHTGFLSQYKNLFHHYTHQTSLEEASTFWGACGAIRRDAFFAVGGFDERYRQPSIEDLELGYRLRQAGYRIRLCKTIQVKHLKRWTVRSLLYSDFFQRALPWTDLILRERSFTSDLNLRWSHRVSVALVGAMLGSTGGTLAWSSFLALSLLCCLLLLSINAPVYRFFLQRRGVRFMLRAVLWHWLYYLYSGLAFGIGLVRYQLRSSRRARPLQRSAAVEAEPEAS